MSALMTEAEQFEQIRKLDKDLRRASETMGEREARYMVDEYYARQEDRIRAANQSTALGKSEEPHGVVLWLRQSNELIEKNIKISLGVYADNHPVGQWAQRVPGIGPVLAAALLAHVDISRCPTVGHIWRFAGLDPTQEWIGTDKARAYVSECLRNGMDLRNAAIAGAMRVGTQVDTVLRYATTDAKGHARELTQDSLVRALAKRPYNAKLKVVCWKIGESFVKVKGNERDVYGKVYEVRKRLEQERNEAGQFRDQAERSLSEKRFGADTQARKWYEQGMLPPARLHLRAKRYAVKLFLSAFHEVAYWVRYQALPPSPYVIEHLGHADYYGVPFAEAVPGLAEAQAARSPRVPL